MWTRLDLLITTVTFIAGEQSSYFKMLNFFKLISHTRMALIIPRNMQDSSKQLLLLFWINSDRSYSRNSKIDSVWKKRNFAKFSSDAFLRILRTIITLNYPKFFVIVCNFSIWKEKMELRKWVSQYPISWNKIFSYWLSQPQHDPSWSWLM
jgi:hypothetical protein